MNFEPRAFRDALGRFASGVTVVSCELDGELSAMTVSAFASVSLDPPLVLICIARKASNHDRIARAGRFGVSVLAADQQALSNRFAGYGGEDAPVDWSRESVKTPVLRGALAWLDCAVEQAVPAGDHTVYIGRVEALGATDGAPLTYWRGGYRSLRSD
jgi:flavin reductase (DIM6/NTAB) family NADH-FMN oxidoreductase RutF